MTQENNAAKYIYIYFKGWSIDADGLGIINRQEASGDLSSYLQY